MDLANKKVLVVGLGISGQSATKLLVNKGASVWVTEKDDNPVLRTNAEDMAKQGVIFELGRHTEQFFKDKDLVVLSPGVNPNSELINWVNSYRTPIISELELASWYVNWPLIGVTGTNGKSTVACLIDHIFRCAGLKSIACGNIGMPMSEVVLKNGEIDVAVVEVSSFQLEYIKTFRPYLSVWLNFSYDHLDHHLSMEDYITAKLRIFENQTEDDWAVINYKELDRVGKIRAKKLIYGKESDIDWKWDEIQLKRQHNRENILAAVAAARIFGIKDTIIRDAVRTFKPLPHRVQYVTNFNGIDFIDDSKATNVHAVISVLEEAPDSIVLILGGRDKGDDFTRLRGIIKEKVKCIIVIGEAKEKIIGQLKGVVPIYEVLTMEDAVGCAYNHAVCGSWVLLSPGCSSFDMFKDYKERGEKFQAAVFSMSEVAPHSWLTHGGV